MTDFPQLQKKPGTTLVLSGGATKAFYFHLGVLKVLDTSEITSIVGASAGSIVGAFLASGTSIESLLTSLHQKQVYLPKFDSWIKTLNSSSLFRPKYHDITRQSLHTGLTGARFLLSLPFLYNKDIVAEALDRLIYSQSKVAGFFNAGALEELFRSLLPSLDFADMDLDLYITATALDTNRRAVFNGRYSFRDEDNEFLTDVPVHKAVRASSAVPGMFEPVKIKGHFYIDGEVKRTLSADIGVSLGDRIIMSHTYQPLRLGEGNGSVRDMGWVNVLKQTLNIVLYERIVRWQQGYDTQAHNKEIIWIHPDHDDTEFFRAPEFSFRPEDQQLMIESGERAARHALEKALS